MAKRREERAENVAKAYDIDQDLAAVLEDRKVYWRGDRSHRVRVSMENRQQNNSIEAAANFRSSRYERLKHAAERYRERNVNIRRQRSSKVGWGSPDWKRELAKEKLSLA